MQGSDTGRRPWIVAFALVAISPVTGVVWVALPNTRAGTLDAIALAAMIGGPVVAGIGAAMSRAVVASGATWVVVALFAAIAAGPTCGLQMSLAPPGTAIIAFRDWEGTTCQEGSASLSNVYGWIILAGILATGLTAAVGVASAGIRWIGRSTIPPA